MSKKTKQSDKAAIKQADEEHAAYEALRKAEKAKKTKQPKAKLDFKTGDWVVVKWDDAPNGLAYVVKARPTKGAKYSSLCFLNGKRTHFRSVNHDQILAVAPSVNISLFGFKVPDIVFPAGTSTVAQPGGV